MKILTTELYEHNLIHKRHDCIFAIHSFAKIWSCSGVYDIFQEGTNNKIVSTSQMRTSSRVLYFQILDYLIRGTDLTKLSY